MLRKYITIFLFAAFTLVACDKGGDTGTGDAQTGTDPGVAGTDTEIERDTEMDSSRERDIDRRTGSIPPRPGTGTDSDTGMGPGTTTNPGTGSIPGGATSPDTGVDSPDTDTGDTTGNP